MTPDLAAIIRTETAQDNMVELTRLNLTAVHHRGLTALLCAPRRGRALSSLVAGPRKKALKRELVDRQALLEALHAMGDSLPAPPGQSLAPKEGPGFLAANAKPLVDALLAITGQEQHQVVIRWNPAEALIRFRDTRELAALVANGAALSRQEMGLRVQSAGERLRMRLRDRYADMIATRVSDAAVLPLDSPEMLLNMATLAPRGDTRLEDTLADIDKVWTDGYRISLIGPGPAVSFSAIRVKRTPRQSVRQAAHCFGLSVGEALEADTLKRAHRAVIHRHHRDAMDGRAGDDQLNRLNAAHAMLTPLATACSDLPGGIGANIPLLASIDREGARAIIEEVPALGTTAA